MPMRAEDSKVLDLGCGRAKHSGAFGVDIRAHPGVDLVHNLDEAEWPLPSDHYEKVYCRDIVEHVADVDHFLRQLHRVSAPGALIEIRTPHFSSWYAYNDPTHRHTFGYFFLDRYTDVREAAESPPLFRYVERRFMFPRLHRWTGVSRLACHNPARYEQLFCFMFPCENLLIRITPVKAAL